MSLVAYGSSEESEEEISSHEISSIVSKSYVDYAVKRPRESVKITIPSLKEFEEEESNKVPEKKNKLQSGFGLFSLLPPPKNTATLTKAGFVPHILKSKKEATTSSSVKPSNTSIKRSESRDIPPSSVSAEHDSDDDISYETEKSSGKVLNFFSLDDSKNASSVKYESSNYLSTETVSLLLEKDKLLIHPHYDSSATSASSEIDAISLEKQPSDLPSSNHLQQPLIQNEMEDTPYSHLYQETNVPVVDANYQEVSSEYYPMSASEPDIKETLLKDEGFLKLQGRKREHEEINIIDINASEQLTDKNEWLMKSLTEETIHRPSRKKHNMPTQQQKRKHQITYLAFQAKEREMDLKNQWGLNNRTRRETQAKYGF